MSVESKVVDAEVVNTPAPEIKTDAEAKIIEGMKSKDIKWREKYKQTLADLEATKLSTERQKKELEVKIESITQARQMSDSKRIEAEVKAMAVAEGLTDLDLIKLIDTKDLKIGDNGEIVGAKEIIADFKSKKPAFFTAAKSRSTSTNASVPADSGKVQTGSAYDIADDQWKNLMRRAQTFSS